MARDEQPRWHKADALFARALDLPRHERAAFLKEAACGDAPLQQRLERLLILHEAAERFLEEPPLRPTQRPAPDPDAPRRVGRYRLLRRIGRGGMGSVYLAERADGAFRQQVALKLIRSGIDSRAARRRFRLERQILARLEHPHIARLYDGGLSAKGQPYLVMEHVEGLPITRYCQWHGLSIEARLVLFREVCQAVHYAHQHLVVHRDLKPSNILVTEAGQVKLLDFGIAKLLGEREPSLTEPGVQLMTPEYASPEQVRGQEITTGSDVYQLGVLLFELLTGQRPHVRAGRGRHELERLICEAEPEKPSTVVLRRQRGQDRAAGDGEGARETRSAERLRRRLRGDLDMICLKALRKEVSRRYGSAAELSEEVRRHLDGLPVGARRDTLFYRASKFVQRHRVGVGAAALVLMTLLGGVVATTRQARIATREAAKAERINLFLQEMLSSADPWNGGREVKVAEVLAAAAEQVEVELRTEPEMEAAIRTTLGMTYRSLGLHGEAELHLRRALEIRKAIYGREHVKVAESLNNLGWILYAKGDHAATEPLYREALAMRRRLLGNEHPDVATSLNNLGWVLHATGDHAEAESFLREALAMRRRLLGNEHPDVATSLNNLAGLLHAEERYAAAESLYHEALAMRRRLLGREHPDVAASLNNLAWLLHDRGDLAAAEPLYREALAMRRRLLGPEHPGLANSIGKLALLLHDQGDLAAAESLYHEALAMRRRLLGPEHGNIANSLYSLATLLHDRGDYAAAEPLYREALAMQRKLFGTESPRSANSLYSLATLLHDRGDYASAEALHREALALFRKKLPEGHSKIAGSLVGLGSLLADRGDPHAAEPLLREALTLLQNKLPDGHRHVALAENALGGCLAQLGHYEDAERLLEKSYAVLSDSRADSRAARRAQERLIRLYEAAGRPEKAAAYRTARR